MNKYLAALSATALISVAPFVMAASSTELTVTGFITPSACDVSFPGGSDVHYGKILVKDLNQTALTPMTRQTKTMNVTCDEPTTLALNVIDNQPGTSSSNTFFGMGLTPADEKIGHYVPWIHNVVADGTNRRAIRSTNQGTTWAVASWAAPTDYLSVSNTSDLLPVAVENLSMDVEIRGWIARADGLTLDQDVNIDGSVTFEVKYL